MAAKDRPDVQEFTAKGRATRERILQAAAQVILSDGLSDLSLDRVRNAASVSGSQLSHYYTDKGALIRAILERQIEVVLDFHRQPRLGGLDTYDDFERWLELNLRYLRAIGYSGTPTYHALAGQLLKSGDETRRTLATGYQTWIAQLEQSFERMLERGVLVTRAEPRELALVVVAGHQGAGTLSFAYRQEWPLTDTLRFVVNYLRLFAADPAERTPHPPRRPRDRQPPMLSASEPGQFTAKGVATQARIIDGAAELMFTHGVARTTLSDVRRKVGVSGSQISHYFSDKRELTRKVIIARSDEVLAFHAQPKFGALESITDLRRWAAACIEEIEPIYLRGGCILGSLTAELLEHDEEVLNDLAAAYERWFQLFHAGISAMRRSGELIQEADPRHLAIALIAAHQGGTTITYTTQSPDPFRAAINAAVDYVASYSPSSRKHSGRTSGKPRSRSAKR